MGLASFRTWDTISCASGRSRESPNAASPSSPASGETSARGLYQFKQDMSVAERHETSLPLLTFSVFKKAGAFPAGLTRGWVARRPCVRFCTVCAALNLQRCARLISCCRALPPRGAQSIRTSYCFQRSRSAAAPLQSFATTVPEQRLPKTCLPLLPCRTLLRFDSTR